MINNSFAYCFKRARLGTTGSSDLEQNKYVGQVSTSKRLITSKDGDFLSCVDNVNENNIIYTSLKQILFNNHEIAANKCKINGQLPLEHIFGFSKTFKKIRKILDST